MVKKRGLCPRCPEVMHEMTENFLRYKVLLADNLYLARSSVRMAGTVSFCGNDLLS